MKKFWVFALFSIIYIEIVTTATPNTYSTTQSILHSCNLSSKYADVTLNGVYLCITDETVPSLKSSMGSTVVAPLSLYSPPKSKTESSPIGVSCFKKKSRCIVFWRNHFEQMTIQDGKITSQLEFYSNDLSFTKGSILENTDYVVLGAFILNIDAPHLARVDLSSPNEYYAGSLGLGPGGRKDISNLEILRFSRWVIMTEEESRRVIVGDITNLTVKDQGQLLSLEGREKSKHIKAIEHFIDSSVFALASDDIKIFKVEGLELLVSKSIGVGSGIIAMQSWQESNDLAILLEDRIEIFRVTSSTTGTPVVTTYQIDTVVLEGLEINKTLNLVYDFKIQDIILVEVDGGHTLKFTPGDSCHINCQACTQSFAPNDQACSSCSSGSTMNSTGNYCKKDAVPNPFGGYQSTYTGLAGQQFSIDQEVIEVIIDDTIDPNKIVENNTSVIFIMIGTFVLLTIIVLFGLISSKGKIKKVRKISNYGRVRRQGGKL